MRSKGIKSIGLSIFSCPGLRLLCPVGRPKGSSRQAGRTLFFILVSLLLLADCDKPSKPPLAKGVILEYFQAGGIAGEYYHLKVLKDYSFDVVWESGDWSGHKKGKFAKARQAELRQVLDGFEYLNAHDQVPRAGGPDSLGSTLYAKGFGSGAADHKESARLQKFVRGFIYSLRPEKQ